MEPETIDLSKWTDAALGGALRYQYSAPPVTTFGNCAAGCGATARGSGVCVACLRAEIDRRESNVH